MADHSRFIGARLSHAACGEFSFGLWSTDAHGPAVEPHGHDDAHLMLAIAGRYLTEAEGQTPARRTTLVYNPHQTFHRDRFEGGGGVFFALTVASAASEAAREFELPRRPILVGDDAVHMLAHRLVRECAGWRPDSPMVAESLCLELLGTLGARSIDEQRRPGWLRRACNLLIEAAPRGIGEVANEVGVHPIHLTRTFRRHLRCTPGEFVLSHRLSTAAGLLAQTRLRLVDVALESGFADQSHLTRRFKAQYGVTPARFRRLAA